MSNVVSQNKVTREVKGEIYDALRSALIAPASSKSKKSWTEAFIKQMLDEAKKDPNGPLGQLIARQLMQDDILTKLDEQTDKALAKDIDFMEYRLIKQLYDKQREVFLDDKIHKKIIIGSRRIGKTTLATRLMVKECIRPERHAVFIGLKFENAIRQAFDETVRMAETIGLVIAKKSKNDGLIQFTNGSSILFKGNYTVRDQDNNFQGDKYSLVILDECQSQKNVQHLLDDLIRPAMSDYSDATLVLTGTPPRIKGTYAEKVWKEFKGWKHYCWTMASNPFIINENHTVDQMIEEICKEKGIKEDAPFIKREYFGEWVYDTEAQVFKDYKTYQGDVPAGFIPTDIAIGTDYGFSDYNAIIALAYNRDTRQAYVIQEKKFNKATISEIVAACKETFEYCKRLAIERNQNFDFSRIGFYCDTNEQSITYELSTNYKLPVYNCYKHDKKMAIAQLADWCRSGIITTIYGGVIADEFDQIVYKRDEQDNITSEIDDDLYHGDAMDALLYASRQYAWDCGVDTGGQSTDKVKKEETRQSTLPAWMQDQGE